MVKVQFKGSGPETVEGFPKAGKDVERTFKGALHLKPGKLYNLSEAEWIHLKEKRKDLRFQQFNTGEKAIRTKEKSKEAVDSTSAKTEGATEAKADKPAEPKKETKTTSSGFKNSRKK